MSASSTTSRRAPSSAVHPLDWVSPGGKPDESLSPRELHDSFVAAIPKNHVAEFLAVEVDKPGPSAGIRVRVGPHKTAGVQVAARVGEDRFLSGKSGSSARPAASTQGR